MLAENAAAAYILLKSFFGPNIFRILATDIGKETTTLFLHD